MVARIFFIFITKTFQTKLQPLLISNLGVSEKIGKVIKQTKIEHFSANYLLQFQVKLALKTLELPKLSNKSTLKGPGATQQQKSDCKDIHGQNISDKLLFSYERPHSGTCSISIFYTSIGKIQLFSSATHFPSN